MTCLYGHRPSGLNGSGPVLADPDVAGWVASKERYTTAPRS